MQKDDENTYELPRNTTPDNNKPNESGRLHLEDFVKIHDPNNDQTLLEMRG